MANPFVWVELHTADAEKAKKFYTDHLGWKLQLMGDMPYTLILGDEGGVGGITASPTQANPKPHWLPYIGVPSLDAATKKAKSLGAAVEGGERPRPGRRALHHHRRPDGSRGGPVGERAAVAPWCD